MTSAGVGGKRFAKTPLCSVKNPAMPPGSNNR